MTNFEKQEIRGLLDSGAGYKSIAKRLNISINSIKSCVHRGLLSSKHQCKQCKCSFEITSKNSTKQFCSDSCRMAWWNSHQDLVIRKAYYHFTCAFCGKEFDSYGNTHRKYCSHRCYTDSLKKENNNGGTGK